ncbi:MAG TPA: rod shape-determining protein RodA [Syntrophomonadaceae bacterium]|nr:rod shape-determining protein RodA [Syntrophomonadaceae bacterium]
MPFNKRLLKNLDYVLIGNIILIMSMSLLILSSATANIAADPLFYVKKHLLSIGLGVICAVLIISFDYTKLLRYDKYIYLLLIILLLVVDIKGIVAKGGRQWLALGPFVFQPSEFGKIMFIICFATFLVKRKGELKTLRDLIPSFLYFAVPFLLIVIQDLGTALVYLVILFGMLYIAGAKPSLLLGIIGSGLAVVILAVGLHLSPLQLPLPLEDYQINRLTAFIDPYKDPHGTGYHIIQSLVAVGSGGPFGKGLYHGTQVQLNFLPEHHTDFIFSVVGEELGFVGAAFILLLYYILLSRTLRTAFQARDLFGRLVVGGIVCMWLFHIFENVGMAIGLMPVTGIPLPFLSHGGSFMITNLAAIGLILNVQLRRENMLF